MTTYHLRAQVKQQQARRRDLAARGVPGMADDDETARVELEATIGSTIGQVRVVV